MLILALDSTAVTATAALWRDGGVLCEYTVNAGNTHSVTLLPMIEHMLKISGTSLNDIDAFAVSAGPGSFTGVRIGAATVKGLAFKEDKPCIGVSALEALAENLVMCRGYICPVMNARRQQVYTALFHSDGEKLTRLLEDSAMSLDELNARLEQLDEPVYFCGDGYFLTEGMSKTVTPERLRLQSASSVAAVAERIWLGSEDKSVFSASALVPVYLRKPQAEREREERLKQGIK